MWYAICVAMSRLVRPPIVVDASAGSAPSRDRSGPFLRRVVERVATSSGLVDAGSQARSSLALDQVGRASLVRGDVDALAVGRDSRPSCARAARFFAVWSSAW